MTQPPIDPPSEASPEPLHVAASRAVVLAVGAGLGGALALSLFFVLRDKLRALPMVLPVTLAFGAAVAGGELLARRLRGGFAWLGVAAVAGPLGLFLSWHWVEGLLSGGYELGLDRVGRVLGQLAQFPRPVFGWWLAIATPCLGLAWVRLRFADASVGARVRLTVAAGVLTGGAAFFALNGLGIGNFREWPLRLLLTLGWSTLAAVGLCLGEWADRRWLAPRWQASP